MNTRNVCRWTISGLMAASFMTISNHIWAADNFTMLSWFQVKPFGQKIGRLEFDTPPVGEALPAFGFSGDFADRAGELHFYRWDLKTGEQLLRVDMKPTWGFDQVPLNSVALTPDKRFALLASGMMEVIWFDVKEGKEVTRYSGHRTPSNAPAISPSLKYKAVSGRDFRVWIWGEQNDLPEGMLQLPSRPYKMEFLSDESVLRVYEPKFVQEWNWQTGKLLKTIEFAHDVSGFHHNPDPVIVDHDLELIFARIENERSDTLVAMREHSGETLWQFKLPESAGFPSNSFWSVTVAHSKKCVIASTSNVFYVLNPQTGEVLREASDVVGSFYIVTDTTSRYLLTPSGNVEVYELPKICR